MSTTYCQFCGSVPAANIPFRAHRGILVLMQYRKMPGPFCRDCGIAAFRQMTADSLVQGWWGPLSFLIANPVTLLANLVNRARIGRLAPPDPGSPALSAYPAKPLLRRWETVGLLVPLVPILLLVFASGRSDSVQRDSYYGNSYIATSAAAVPASDPRNAKAGDCVRDKYKGNLNAKYPELEIVPCSDTRAQAVVLGRVASAAVADIACGTSYPQADQVYTSSSGIGNGYLSADFALCLKKMR